MNDKYEASLEGEEVPNNDTAGCNYGGGSNLNSNSTSNVLDTVLSGDSQEEDAIKAFVLEPQGRKFSKCLELV